MRSNGAALRSRRAIFRALPGRNVHNPPVSSSRELLLALWSGKVVEEAQKIAVQIRGGELMQAPGLGLRGRNDLCLISTPQLVQRIHLFLAVEIQPDQHWTGVAVVLPESRVGQEHSAVPFGDTGN